METMEIPRAITHVGIVVTDLEQAMEWYRRVFGFQLLAGSFDFAADESHFGRIAVDLLGPKFRKGRLAMLDAGNQVGLEVFEFAEPKTERRTDAFEEYLSKSGPFHFCVIDPDVTALSRRIAENGGKQRSQVWEFSPGMGFFVSYCEDPWGNIVEIYSHSTQQIWSSMAAASMTS